jgi:hypothetical protein
MNDSNLDVLTCFCVPIMSQATQYIVYTFYKTVYSPLVACNSVYIPD